VTLALAGLALAGRNSAMPDTNSTSTPDQVLFDRVVEALRTVYDPEIPVNIWELGLIYGVKTNDDGSIAIDMTLTAPSCPVAGEMPGMVQRTVSAVEGVTACTVELVWEPPWDQGRMSEEAKLQLDMFY
jgi:FeS assembly SUF system protein